MPLTDIVLYNDKCEERIRKESKQVKNQERLDTKIKKVYKDDKPRIGRLKG